MDVTRLERRALDIREEAVMYECAYLLYGPTNKLGEAFVVTQLVKEVITADDDKLAS